MNFRLRLALWSALSVLMIAAVLIFSAHWHLDDELRKDRWDRTQPLEPVRATAWWCASPISSDLRTPGKLAPEWDCAS